MDYREIIENIPDTFKIPAIIILCTSKFVPGVGAAIACNYSPLDSFLITTFGGFIGIIIYSYASEWVISKYDNIVGKFRNKPIRTFRKRNRFIIKMKNTYGLIGIAILGPTILSIPLGAILAIRLTQNRYKSILYLSISLLLWSIFLNLIYFKISN